jgi:hypothetical protein
LFFYQDFLFFETDERENESVVGFHLDFELAVYVGDGT